MPTVKLDETTIAQVSAPDSTTNTRSRPSEAASINQGADATTSTPFYKRKRVLIAAPIVAGALLLGVGGSIGYAVGDNGNTGGAGDHDDLGSSDHDRGQVPGHGKHGHGGKPWSQDSHTPNGDHPGNDEATSDGIERTPEPDQFNQNSNNGSDNNDTESDATQS